MVNPYADLLDKTRLPQPAFQRLAVVSLFSRIASSPGPLGPTSTAGLEAISQCIRSHSAAVVDQAIRELCRFAASGHRLPTSCALIELQSGLEGCERHFAPIYVKGIGFLCRITFRIDTSWGRQFVRVESHPFVKVLSCCEEAHEELIHQRTVGTEKVAEQSLFLWDNDHLITQNWKVVLPLVFPALERNMRGHLNQTVQGLATNMRKLFVDADQELFDRCSLRL